MSDFLGIDTSNYTTSAAIYESHHNVLLQEKMLLPVKKGEKAGTVSYYLADEKIAENVVVTERAVEKRTLEKC